MKRTSLFFSVLILSVSFCRAAEPASITIVPHGDDAFAAFAEMSRKGLTVVMYGHYAYEWDNSHESDLLVPVELRFKPVEGRTLVEAVAAARKLKVTWVRDGKYAILYPGVSDTEIERVRKDFESPDIVVRRDAVWRACWMPDVRAVALLIEGAHDADAELARQSLYGLSRAGWETALVVDDAALDSISADLESNRPYRRKWATSALGRLHSEKAMALLEKMRADPDENVRREAAWSLGYAGGDKAIALLEGMYDDTSPRVRFVASGAIGNMDGDKVLEALAKALKNKKENVRHGAIHGLGTFGVEKATMLIEKALAEDSKMEFALNPRENLDREKIFAQVEQVLAGTGGDGLRAMQRMGYVGGDRAVDLLEQVIKKTRGPLRDIAVYSLGGIGGERAQKILERLLVDKDSRVRELAVYALVRARADCVLPVLEKQLLGPDTKEAPSWRAAEALKKLDKDKAVAVLERALPNDDSELHDMVIRTLGSIGGPKALAVLEKAMAGAKRDERMNILSAISDAGGEQAYALLEKSLTDEKVRVQRSALYGMARMGGERALTLLETYFASTDKDKAAFAVSAMREAAFINCDRAIAILEKALNSDDDYIRRNAASGLGNIGGPRALPLLEKAIADKDLHVRCSAADALWEYDGEKAYAVLVAAIKRETNKQAQDHMAFRLKDAFGNRGYAGVEDVLKSLPTLKETFSGPPTDYVLSQGIEKAKKESKLIFLSIGFPECYPCRMLDRFNADPGVAAILKKYYVLVKIDYENMEGGLDLFKKYGNGGAPSWCVIDTDKKLVGEKGRGGFPTEKDSIQHYQKVLKTATPAITDDELNALEERLKHHGEMD